MWLGLLALACGGASPGGDDPPGIVDCEPGWLDRDGDGWGGEPTTECGQRRPRQGGDCDDLDPEVHPGAVEDCDGLDEDCDGAIDEEARDAWKMRRDVDGDGFTTNEASIGCGFAPGWAPENPFDCDDLDPSVPRFAWPDADGDGYGGQLGEVWGCNIPAGFIDRGGDCDDHDPTLPAPVEICGNGVDDDCDGRADPAQEWWVDADGDGFGGSGASVIGCEPLPGRATATGDCDDADPTRHPKAPEVCPDAVDQDCDGATECNIRHAHALGMTSYRYGGDAASAGDVDGDGFADVVLLSTMGAWILRGPFLTKTVLAPSESWLPSWAVLAPDVTIAVGDLGGDGLDVVACVGANALVFEHPEDGSKEDEVHLIAGPDLEESGWYDHCDPAMGDLDGDGDDELLLGYRHNADGVAIVDDASRVRSVFHADGLVAGSPGRATGWRVRARGDVDGDGRDDAIVTAGSGWAVVTEAGSGTISVDDVAFLRAGAGDDASSMALFDHAGDVDGDGLGDVIASLWNQGGPVELWTDLADEGPEATLLTLGGHRELAGAGDLDGNGHDDFLIGSFAGDDAGSVSVVHGPVSGAHDLRSSGKRWLGEPVFGEGPPSWLGASLAPAGDVDGDGRADWLAETFQNGGGWFLVNGN